MSDDKRVTLDLCGSMVLKRHGSPYAVRIDHGAERYPVVVTRATIDVNRALIIPLQRRFWWRRMYRSLAWTLNRPGRG